MTDEEAIVEFERLLRNFCTAQDSPSQHIVAEAMAQFIPGKTGYGHIWRLRPAKASADQVRSLMTLAESKDYLVHVTAIDCLSLCGNAALEALPLLTRLAQHKDELTRHLGARALERLGGTSTAVRERLREMTQGRDLPERLVAVEALRQWNWRDPDTAHHLLQLVKDSDDATAQAAAKSLAPVGAEWSSILPVLFEQLESNRTSRAGFLDAVPEMNELVNPYIPRIVKALSDKSPAVRAEACDIVARLGKYGTSTHDVRSARLGVTKLLKDPEESVRTSARRALQVLNDQQKP